MPGWIQQGWGLERTCSVVLRKMQTPRRIRVHGGGRRRPGCRSGMGGPELRGDSGSIPSRPGSHGHSCFQEVCVQWGAGGQGQGPRSTNLQKKEEPFKLRLNRAARNRQGLKRWGWGGGLVSRVMPCRGEGNNRTGPWISPQGLLMTLSRALLWRGGRSQTAGEEQVTQSKGHEGREWRHLSEVWLRRAAAGKRHGVRRGISLNF